MRARLLGHLSQVVQTVGGHERGLEGGNAPMDFFKEVLDRCQQEFLKDIIDDESFINSQRAKTSVST